MKKRDFSLKKEISLVLAVKLLLIFMLWFLCFQHPVEKNLNVQDIASHIIK